MRNDDDDVPVRRRGAPSGFAGTTGPLLRANGLGVLLAMRISLKIGESGLARDVVTGTGRSGLVNVYSVWTSTTGCRSSGPINAKSSARTDGAGGGRCSARIYSFWVAAVLTMHVDSRLTDETQNLVSKPTVIIPEN